LPLRSTATPSGAPIDHLVVSTPQLFYIKYVHIYLHVKLIIITTKK
jgi:hypothetical protein